MQQRSILDRFRHPKPFISTIRLSSFEAQHGSILQTISCPIGLIPTEKLFKNVDDGRWTRDTCISISSHLTYKKNQSNRVKVGT